VRLRALKRSPGSRERFFYAVARSLLVSHRKVASVPTIKLITKALAEPNANPKIATAASAVNIPRREKLVKD
jgi:hypothetical protein